MTSPKCVCGHAQKNHISGRGLCLVKSCKQPICIGYIPVVATQAGVVGCSSETAVERRPTKSEVVGNQSDQPSASVLTPETLRQFGDVAWHEDSSGRLPDDTQPADEEGR